MNTRNIFLLILVFVAAGVLFLQTRPSTVVQNQKTSTQNVTPSPLASPTPTSLLTSIFNPPTKSPTPTQKQPLLWGTYTGWNISDVTNFEAKVGKPVKLIATFVHWGNEKEFPEELGNYAKTHNKTFVIYWEAMDYNVETPTDSRFSYDAILQGKWDSYMASFAKSVKDFGGPVILIPFEEMNDDGYNWSGSRNGNSVEKHIQAYRHVRSFFKDVPNVKFAWDVNSTSAPDTPANSLLKYYPGDAYVDYIGVNGFNFDDPWMNFDEIFSDALTKLETINKPIFIFSMASAEGSRKPAWIKDTLTVGIPKHPKIIGWIWFNENKEKDWRVWSDNASLNAFKESLR